MSCERCQNPTSDRIMLCNVYRTHLCHSCLQAFERDLDGHPAVDAFSTECAMVTYWLAAAHRQDVFREYLAALKAQNQLGTELKQVIWAWLDSPSR